MSQPVPVTIVSGFLGSGKTTLLNEILRGDHGLRVAVIVNEFGAVGIDSHLVKGGAQFIEMANGCICCALNEELEGFLRKLKDLNGFDYVVLETTGLADPLPVAWTFARQGLEDSFRVDALLTVVDAQNVAHALAEHEMATLQIERGDILVLNKCDLVSDEGQAAESTIRTINSHALLFKTQHGAISWSLLLGSGFERDNDTSETESARHTNERYETWTFQTDGTFDDAALEDWLYEVPSKIFRIKGLVRSNFGSGWRLINCVSGRIDFRQFEPEGAPRSAIVFIGPELPITELERACSALVL